MSYIETDIRRGVGATFGAGYAVDKSFPRRKRDAGEALFLACEACLGVEGPTALARVTRRSKAWWSKLRSGKAPLPTWSELSEEVLPRELEAGALTHLRAQHQEIWASLHDSALAERLRAPAMPDLAGDRLTATRELARQAMFAGRYAEALLALKLLESLLSAFGVEALPTEELDILAGCFADQSVCESHLGNHDAAMRAATHAVESYRRAGSVAGEAGAAHQLGLACSRAGQFQAALEHYATARHQYEHLGLTGEVIRARRDAASALLALGHFDEAERELHSILGLSAQLQPSHRFATLLKLTDLAVLRGDAGEARRWWTRAEVYARDHAAELADHLQRQHVRETRARLAQAVAALAGTAAEVREE